MIIWGIPKSYTYNHWKDFFQFFLPLQRLYFKMRVLFRYRFHLYEGIFKENKTMLIKMHILWENLILVENQKILFLHAIMLKLMFSRQKLLYFIILKPGYNKVPIPLVPIKSSRFYFSFSRKFSPQHHKISRQTIKCYFLNFFSTLITKNFGITRKILKFNTMAILFFSSTGTDTLNYCSMVWETLIGKGGKIQRRSWFTMKIIFVTSSHS